MPETVTPAFTLLRSSPLLYVASIVFNISGGTASYGCVKGFISTTAGAGAVPAHDINGQPMVTIPGFTTRNAGVSNWSAAQSFVAPAGTYYGIIGYYLFNGATTTFTDTAFDVTVYQLAG